MGLLSKKDLAFRIVVVVTPLMFPANSNAQYERIDVRVRELEELRHRNPRQIALTWVLTRFSIRYNRKPGVVLLEKTSFLQRLLQQLTMNDRGLKFGERCLQN